jgi:sulfatase modifying factor 1
MVTRPILLLILSLLAAFTSIANLHAQPLVRIETVLVGDAGNAADVSTGFGSVPYEFRIGRYEVTIGEYVVFLNSVAATNTENHIVDLYHPDMAITRTGSPGSYSYELDPSTAGNPVGSVSWFDAARFANWLSNGATNGADTEDGAYSLNGATSGTGFGRNASARWWIPTEDEWYKAAHYKSGGTKSGYWRFPTQSDTAPGPRSFPSDEPNAANFRMVLSGPLRVGSYSRSGGPYGTFDQGGNLNEWVDGTVWNGFRFSYNVRGGGYPDPTNSLSVSARPSSTPSERPSVGFRVAGVPQVAEDPMPRITAFLRSPDSFSMSWAPSQRVHVQRRASLASGDWEISSSNNTSGSYLDAQPPAGGAFYRLVAP